MPESEIVLDPMSRRDDYTDARYIHRFKWVTSEQIESLFGKGSLAKLTEYYNFTSLMLTTTLNRDRFTAVELSSALCKLKIKVNLGRLLA